MQIIMQDSQFQKNDSLPDYMTTPRESTVPWYIWCAVIAVTSAMVGTHWDIAWHRSIGRDTFWTPAHMAIYFAGVLAGSPADT